MYDHILVPYDGSDEARKGAEHGIELAAALDATVHALYVIDLPGTPRALALRDDEEEMREEYRDYGEEVLANLGTVAEEHGVDYETHFKTGAPSEEIVEFAEGEGMDAIVLGSAFRGKLGNLLGGTTDKVVRTSSIPVISQRMSVNDI
ncbi:MULTISPECIES: universal stress protein [Haloarcula]|jgi:nucleotide-binding universal stress UspA family protein|uniref:Universal stress protein n=3 Tax=Haloarcula marismortui TaxID=2238 RepID=Q5V5Y9_HALMA|nr:MULTISPECIES: universal stress protein [Haloarcula]AAV45063.1 universal stress protein [Haloarcula marismortui ATCC 43049]EMA10418.1 universal stress protein [Haloarcula californiae ATCC 33799]EMA10724.1 universal stress protein [Haloarcula sinaiiensis ATCC 33800]NHN62480.1 universal stress protein [Haloarcula sp. JP-Z28]NHX41048.1 universal stress protein [Haloarcula sp. R1-2]